MQGALATSRYVTCASPKGGLENWQNCACNVTIFKVGVEGGGKVPIKAVKVFFRGRYRESFRRTLHYITTAIITYGTR